MFGRRYTSTTASPFDAEIARLEQDGFVRVGSVDMIGRSPVSVDLGGPDAVLVTRRGRDIFAFVDRCPHFGLSLSDGRLTRRAIECAAHGYRWDLKSGAPLASSRGCVKQRLAMLRVGIVNDVIYVRQPDPGVPLAGRAALANQ